MHPLIRRKVAKKDLVPKKKVVLAETVFVLQDTRKNLTFEEMICYGEREERRDYHLPV